MRMRRRAQIMVGAVAAAVLLAAPGPQLAQAQATAVAGSAGIGDPYFPLDGNGGIDVRHYAIRDTYDFAAAALSGTTTLTVRATEALSSFHLDFLLPVSSATVDGVSAGVSRPRTHEVVITPATPIARGSVVKVRLAYAGTPGTRSYAGESNWLANGAEVVAMNEPHMAPWWFPSNDHPADKATFDIAITAPSTKQVISSGVQTSRVVNGTAATTTWHMAQPMATYLAFFAAGDYYVARGTSRAGIPFVTAVSKRLTGSTLTRARRLIAQSGAITDWLQHEVGRYPFASTGGLVTGFDPHFALENQTRPTYPAWIDHTTVVHELAHQWFGDSVALRRWRDIWLNEGFAVYLEHRYVEAHGGATTRRWLQAYYDYYRTQPSFWRVSLRDPGANDIFSASVYDRGAMALEALRVRIGSKDFRTLLRAWAAQHRGGNATINQFIGLAHRISGQRLDGFFDAWLRADHAPRPTAANGLA